MGVRLAQIPTIKPYTAGNEKALFDVFRSAIVQVCSHDYSPAQIAAWLPEQYDHRLWSEKMATLKPYVAVLAQNGLDVAAGYADVQDDGYIDHFFVHGDYQSQGVGKALMNTLLSEKISAERLYSHVSITAKPFFETYGFKVVRANSVRMRGVELTNFIMERKNKWFI